MIHRPPTPAFARFAGDFEMLAAVLASLSLHCPSRTTIRQALFIAAVAHAHAMGRAVTLSDIVQTLGDSNERDELTGEVLPMLGKAIERSALVFREPSRHYPDALAWIEQVADPDDLRKKYLRLTQKGERELADVINALVA
jgi:hypothetical protein